MKKSELIAKLAETAGVSKKVADDVLSAFEDVTLEAVKSGDEVRLSFGKFLIRERSARTGVNPKTGEKIKISASKSIWFKAGKKGKGL